MLEPREADIPVLFLVLVVLPLAVYILLGKWSEAAKKRERINLLAQLAAEEDFRVEAMATACVIPPLPSSKNGIHVCARCFSVATTRCSRCKSVRYWYVLKYVLQICSSFFSFYAHFNKNMLHNPFLLKFVYVWGHSNVWKQLKEQR